MNQKTPDASETNGERISRNLKWRYLFIAIAIEYPILYLIWRYFK